MMKCPLHALNTPTGHYLMMGYLEFVASETQHLFHLCYYRKQDLPPPFFLHQDNLYGNKGTRARWQVEAIQPYNFYEIDAHTNTHL